MLCHDPDAEATGGAVPDTGYSASRGKFHASFWVQRHLLVDMVAF